MKALSDYFLSRKQASTLLGVSLRTLDRYIRLQKLSFDKVSGRILLSEKEINNLLNFFRGRKKYELSKDRVKKGDIIGNDSYVHQKKSVGLGIYQGIEEIRDRIIGSHSLSNNDQNVYKGLFEKFQEDLKENQKRLEGANYRVGQLEAKLETLNSHYLPLAEHQKHIALLKSGEIDLNSRYFEEKLANKDTELLLRNERLNKQIIGVMFFIVVLSEVFFWWVLRG